MKTLKLIYTLLAILLAACGNDKTKEANETEHQDEHADHEVLETVILTEEQAKSIKVEFGHIERKQLTASLKANGILKVPNQNKASVSSIYGGTVKSILIQPGNKVSKGQVIALIVNPAFIQLQEEYLTLASKITLAKLENDRQKELHEGNAGALKNLQQSEAELKVLLTRRASLKKQLQGLGINPASLNDESIKTEVPVISPISGSVSKVAVNLGSNVDANAVIAEIVDNSQLHLDLYIYEKDLPRLKEGQTIHFTLTNNPGREYDADIYGISNTFEDNTKAIAVHASVKGDKTGLMDGMSITALISLDNVTVPAVPQDAIVNFEGQDYIFILADSANARNNGHEEEHRDEKAEKHVHKEHENTGAVMAFERIPVRKGTSDVGYSEITLLKDIPQNAKVVTKGAFFILAKQTNAGEGHAH